MISRIIKVEVRVISQSQRLRLLIDNYIILLYTDGKQHKGSELDMITNDLEYP